MAVVEYTILVGFVDLRAWSTCSATTPAPSPSPAAGSACTESAARAAWSAGFLIAVFAYSGWDGTIYVNEEVKHRRTQPGPGRPHRGRPASPSSTRSPGRPAGRGLAGQAPGELLVRAGLRGPGARRRRLGQGDGAGPRAVGHRHHRHRHRGQRPHHLRHGQLPGAAGVPEQRPPPVPTPAAASIVIGCCSSSLGWIYLLATSVQNAFTDVIDVTGLLFALFYVLTALATIVYYRRRVFSNVVGRAGPRHPAARRGRVPGLGSGQDHAGLACSAELGSGRPAVGLLLLSARFIQKSDFFSIPRESAGQSSHRASSRSL